MGRVHYKLLVWQEAMELVTDIYAITENFPSEEMYGLTSQLRRAAVSVPSNIAEGAGRESKKEFLHYLSVARGSLSEVDTQLLLAQKLRYCRTMTRMNERMDKVFALLGGLMKSLKKEINK
ncbi:hypothetical protein DGMP_07660 [Desulfomarina profundi]|uniref:Four helix bundle protein n=1 Tax=Desulfomarina profundi TaxID=2772557 RepID=A0A8D5FEY5_9BACT|nr:four helix bundle protein [Desulfomarina profundi]BCL60073.1 hypothetical protein DGMP_07660 [Desulfomarina profundi]